MPPSAAPRTPHRLPADSALRGAAGRCDLRPQFIHEDGRTAAGLNQLASKGEAIDPLGLAMVLELGYQLAGRTVLKRVSVDEIDAGTFATGTPPSVREMADLTLAATRARLGDDAPMVLLSGGRDSRLILLSLISLGVRPSAVLTLDQCGPESDAAVAEQLCRRLGLPIERVAAGPFDAGRESTRHRRQSYQSLEHGWFVDLAERVRSLDGPVTDGIGAGVLSTGSLLEDEPVAHWRAGRMRELFEWTAGHGAHVSPLFIEVARAEGLPIASRAELLDAFETVMKSLADAPNPLGMYSLLHWTRRGIAASAYGQLPHERVMTPLYDTGLCRAVASIPMEEARMSDWREQVLARMDATGVPFSVRERAVLPRWLRAPARAVRSRSAWSSFVRGLPAPLARLAAVADGSRGQQRTFGRAAVGLLASLEQSTGFLGT